jgi:serine/threonine protein kinase
MERNEQNDADPKSPTITQCGRLSGKRLAKPAALPFGYAVDGKYLIEKHLGTGSSGTVYQAVHRDIGRRIAIKVIHHALATRSDILAYFKTEARICAQIRSRHVGQVFDVGRLKNGAPYMVMELLEGRTLEDLLQRGPLPIPTVVAVGQQLLSALDAAHSLGVIHRDVKPSNLIVTEDVTGEVIVKLVDFGIAKPIANSSATRTAARSLSEAENQHLTVGTPGYMPPEQIQGNAMDNRTDIYATGVVLYEMVTGRLPFEAKELADLTVAVLRNRVTLPSTIRPDCPPELERIILRAMSRDRLARFQSASKMAKELTDLASTYHYPTGNDVWLPVFKLRSTEVATGARNALPQKLECTTEIEQFAPYIPRSATRQRSRLLVSVALGLGVLALIVTLYFVPKLDRPYIKVHNLRHQRSQNEQRIDSIKHSETDSASERTLRDDDCRPDHPCKLKKWRNRRSDMQAKIAGYLIKLAAW